MTAVIRTEQRFALLVASPEVVLLKPQFTRLFLRITPLRFEMFFHRILR